MNQVQSQGRYKVWDIFAGPFDPCPPRGAKTFVVPPNVYITFQPPGLPQFSAMDALHHGTLWPALFNRYPGPVE